MENLTTFQYKELKIETFYNGSSKIPNKVYLNDNLVYEDKTFRPSPLINIDSIECIFSLLGFYLLRKGDVEEDFFKDWSPELLEWSENSETAEELRLYNYDYDDSGELPEALNKYLTVH